jgi:hypothetical protein
VIDQLTDWLHAYLLNNEPQVTPRGLAVALLDSFQMTPRGMTHADERAALGVEGDG